MLEKSPLKYPLAKAISCLDPKVAKNKILRNERFQSAVDYSTEHNWVTGKVADRKQEQLDKISSDDLFILTLNEFENV